MKKTFWPAFGALALLWLGGCKSSKADLQVDMPANYVALSTGKYIIYRLDSTVYVNSGRSQEVHSYQERHLVDSMVLDGQNRPSWRVFRAIRNLAGTTGWQQSGSYLLTPTNNTLELQEDNMRTLRLVTPVQPGTTWKANRYLNSEPYSTLYDFNNDNNIAEWDNTVSAAGETVTLNGHSYPNVLTVQGINDKVLPDTVTVSNNIAVAPTGSKLIWIRGTATSPVTIEPPVATIQGQEFTAYNFSNTNALLNGIVTPPTFGRNFEFRSGSWTYGNAQDTLTSFLPFGFKNFYQEQYAKGIGMITQELIMYEFQPNPNGTPYSIGFGVKRTILEHN
jgi:hypothetical protein